MGSAKLLCSHLLGQGEHHVQADLSNKWICFLSPLPRARMFNRKPKSACLGHPGAGCTTAAREGMHEVVIPSFISNEIHDK